MSLATLSIYSGDLSVTPELLSLGADIELICVATEILAVMYNIRSYEHDGLDMETMISWSPTVMRRHTLKDQHRSTIILYSQPAASKLLVVRLTITGTAFTNELRIYTSYHGLVSTVFQGRQYAYMVSARERYVTQLVAKCTPEIGFVLRNRPHLVPFVLLRGDLTRVWLACGFA
jgi:hypothetical protein